MLALHPAARRVVPNRKVQIDWSHPLARGLIGCWLPGVSGGIDLTGHCPDLVPSTTAGQPAYGVISEEGPGFGLSGSFANALYGLAPAIYKQFPLSLYYRGDRNGVGSVGGGGLPIPYLIFIDFDGAVTPPYSFAAIGELSNQDFSTYGAQWNNTTTQQTTSSPTNINVAGTMSCLGTFGGVGGNVICYSKGVQVSSTAFGPSTATDPASQISINGWQAAGRYSPTIGYLACIWNRELTADEAALLDSDPYAFLIPAEGEMPALSASGAAKTDLGFEAQSLQPPYPRSSHRAALEVGDPGTQAVQVNFVNFGGHVQPPQPPRQRFEQRGAVLPREDGNEAKLFNWRNFGWEVQPPQPPHPHPERNAAAILRGDDGTQGTKINFFNFGWSIILHQPRHPRPEQAGAVAIGDTGTEAKFVFVPPPVTFAGEIQFVSRRSPSIQQRASAASGKSNFAAFNLTAWADGLAWQPLYLRAGRNGVIAGWENGNEKPMPAVAASVAWWEIQSPVLRMAPTIFQRAAAASGRSSFAAFNMGPWTEVQSLQPPSYPRARQRYPGTKGSSQFRIFPDLVKMGWEGPLPQPQYPRGAHLAATLVIGDPGNQAPMPVVVKITWGFEETSFAKRNVYRAGTFTERDVETPMINFFPFGWMVQPIQPGHPNPEKRAAGGIARGDDGTQAQRINFLPLGWEVQPIQPGHPAPEKRAGGIAKGDEGNAASQINFFPAGWQVQPHQPQHPRPERAGSIMVGEPGNEGIFSFIAPVFVPEGYNPTPFMPRVRFARAGSLARGEDGTEGLYSVWLPSGWQFPDPTQRARRGAAGAIQEEWRGGDQPEPVAGWGFELPDVPLRRQGPRNLEQPTFVPISAALASFTWGDLDSGVMAWSRRRLRPGDSPFSPHALGARFSWGDIDAAMTFPTRRRTLTRAEFHIEGKFVFVPPPPVTYNSNPDNLLRRTLFHPGAAIMQFDGGWFQQRYVSVFFATSIITQASGDTAVTAATGQTVLSNQA